MAKQFNGVVNVDIRDSIPDWTPFLQPHAPEGAPNVLQIVWDDVGFGAMDVFGGPIETPDAAAPRRPRRALVELPHHRAVLADPLEPADRPQRDLEQHGRHHRGRRRLPRLLGADPVRERHDRRGPQRAGLEHVLRREVAPHARRGVRHVGVEGPLAARPRLRALLRVPGRRDQPVVSRPDLRQPPGRPAVLAGRGLPPLQGPHRQGRSSSSATPSRSRPTSPGTCTSRPARATRRTTSRPSGRTATRAASTPATRRSARRSWPRQKRMGLLGDDVELSPINPHGEPDVTGPTASPGPRWT